ncbi:hypothetical protein [Morganella morganii IS15]|nr:hypothetical protein CSB69_2294 [Morganella morganii]EMP50449.1 hypothetical protein C790_02329 [Morganella morganii SC01]CDK66604.1 hypothetical protein [Morganella morganii IS15]
MRALLSQSGGRHNGRLKKDARIIRICDSRGNALRAERRFFILTVPPAH